MREKEAVEAKLEMHGITLRALIIMLLFITLGTFYSMINFHYSAFFKRQATFPWIIFIFIGILLASRNPKWGFTPAEMAYIMGAGCLVYSWMYLMGGYAEISFPHFTINGVASFIPQAIQNPTLGSIYLHMTPWYLFPMDDRTSLALILINGIAPGQSFPLWSFLIPSLTWTIFFTLTGGITLFFIFAIFGKPWVEKERLVFPIAVAAVEVLDQMKVDPSTGKLALTNLKLSRAKLLWIGFIIGIAIGIIPAMSTVIPALAGMVYGYGEVTLRIEPLANIPGANAITVFNYPFMFLLMVLLSPGVLWTIVIFWVGFGIIYHTLAVQLGWTPYKPGLEYAFNWSADWIGRKPPFPYTWMALSGGTVGAGILLFWSQRERIKELILMALNKRSDEIDYGLSMKRLTYFGLACIVLLLIFLIATGVDPLVSIAFLIMFSLGFIVSSRAWSELWEHQADIIDASHYIYYPIGVATGAWKAVPDGQSYSLFMLNNWAYGSNVSSWLTRCGGGLSGGSMASYYKVAREARLNLKHVMILLMVMQGFLVIFSYMLNIWFWAYGGGMIRTKAYGGAPTGKGTAAGDLVWSASAPTVEAGWQWYIIGIIFVFVLYFLRAKFPLFPINPYLINPILGCLPYYWSDAIVALLIRYIAVKTIGVRKFMEYYTPVAVGVILGAAFVALPSTLYETIAVTFPAFQRYRA
jgi:hypothetical protein